MEAATWDRDTVQYRKLGAATKAARGVDQRTGPHFSTRTLENMQGQKIRECVSAHSTADDSEIIGSKMGDHCTTKLCEKFHVQVQRYDSL